MLLKWQWSTQLYQQLSCWADHWVKSVTRLPSCKQDNARGHWHASDKLEKLWLHTGQVFLSLHTILANRTWSYWRRMGAYQTQMIKPGMLCSIKHDVWAAGESVATKWTMFWGRTHCQGKHSTLLGTDEGLADTEQWCIVELCFQHNR